ncbi:MAG: selenocysteine-specific translation elongation factor [Aquificaceae bacterium]|jgi:selenocysteine-specific elongation factor|uniref:selenocysteine-specific translation elongation factor n=1 Tax=Hydrogenobacter sp. Uz 6-8 TaxID=3384828 RepID=UPI000F281FC9|nr:MAG: selenocysteine-specific translation elongation factor [Aquificota bacterium]
MRYFPLGIAGHVDHGKTSLVRALTSIDTDRLPEEKRRGMSIDIGFAFLDFPEKSLRVEIIDLPGHERFIKNAICGLAPVWGLLLLVDSGEGVMPQTVEHTRLAKSFGIEDVLLVLTKADRVDEETLELAREEALQMLNREGVRVSGVFPLSAVTGYGLEELKSGILEYAERNFRDKEGELFRFLVDSAFSVKGYGTVLRGSCISGRVLEGDILTLEPLGKTCRVRRMQNHGVFVKEGRAGERLALNIPELEPHEVERGCFLVKGIKSSKKLLVRLKGNPPRGLGYAFFGMREVPVYVSGISEDVCIFRLSEPVPAVRGDRGPLLNSSGELVGGYEVLHPFPVRVSKRFIRENLSLLQSEPLEYLLLESGLKGLSLKEVFSFYGKPLQPPRAPEVEGRFYHQEVLALLTKRLKELLREKGGVISLSEAVSRLKTSEGLLEFILKNVKDIRLIEGYVVDAKASGPEELEGYRRLIELLSEGIREEKELEPYREYLSLAVRKGRVYSLGDYLYVSKELFEEYVKRLRAVGREFTLQEAKEVLGFTRKYLIPLLEHMDRLGITRREGERRVFLR